MSDILGAVCGVLLLFQLVKGRNLQARLSELQARDRRELEARDLTVLKAIKRLTDDGWTMTFEPDRGHPYRGHPCAAMLVHIVRDGSGPEGLSFNAIGPLTELQLVEWTKMYAPAHAKGCPW